MLGNYQLGVTQGPRAADKGVTGLGVFLNGL